MSRISQELGCAPLYYSTCDTKVLQLQRFVRLSAFSASTLILALYLSELGFSDARIGLFLGLTLAGDIVTSLLLTLIADRLGRRWVLALGGILMAGSGVVFGLCTNHRLLLLAAVVGVISPSGNEIGPFRSVEESTLTQLTPFAIRTDIFAWYNLIGIVGQALGTVACGTIVQHLQSRKKWDALKSYRVVFLIYAVLGLIGACLAMFLSKRCEIEDPNKKAVGPVEPSEGSPLLQEDEELMASRSCSLFPSIRKESMIILLKLSLLFMVDSIASGLVFGSMITYFFSRKFQLQEEGLGVIFATASLASAASILIALPISKRIGLIETMVYTHLPSTIMLAIIPVPTSLGIATTLLILRSCTNSMDVAPRSTFLAAVVLPHERSVIMGVVNVVKTLSQSFGLAMTGVLAGRDVFWVAFVVAGVLKAGYDLGLLALFLNHQMIEERDGEATSSDEDGTRE